MATPNGYILIKKSELTDSESAKAAPKVEDRPLSEYKERKLSNLLTGLSLNALGRKVSSLPPALNSTPMYRHTFRYVAQDASATVKVLDPANMLLSFGSLAISSTGMYSVHSAFKIHKITIWPAVSGSGAVQWDSYTTNTHNPDIVKVRPMPTGVTVTGGSVYVPPKESEASWWWSGQGSAEFVCAISATVGSVVDVDVTVCMQDVGTNITGTGFTSLVTGIMYYPALDGRSTNDFAPFGRTNAT